MERRPYSQVAKLGMTEDNKAKIKTRIAERGTRTTVPYAASFAGLLSLCTPYCERYEKYEKVEGSFLVAFKSLSET